jgi:hypothetical protein
MDLFFIGRSNGREFIEQTTPIFLKYLGCTEESNHTSSAKLIGSLTSHDVNRNRITRD